MRRASALAASVFGVLVLAACGGGGGGGGGTKTTVSGTAAQGAAIAGATLTLVDAAGTSRTATSKTDGTFTIDTTGLIPPFMIKLVSGDTTLFSVSASADAEAVINVTPLTDLILRTWYEVQGVSMDTAFAAPASNAAPSPLAVTVIGQVVQRIVQLWLDQAGVGSDFNIISSPFDADGTGIDQVLDWTTVDPSTGDIVITDGTTTQNTTVTYPPAGGSVTVDTTTTGDAGTSSSTTSTTVPVGTQQTALEAITTLVGQFESTVNTKGSALAGSDLDATFMDPALLADGLDHTGYAAFLAGHLAGATVSFTLVNVQSLDEVAGTAEFSYQFSMTQGGQTGIQPLALSFRKVGSSWLLSGNGRIAELELRTGMVTNQGADAGAGGPILEVNVAAPEGTVSGATVTGPTAGPWATETPLSDEGLKDGRDTFGLSNQTSVDAGTAFAFKVTPAVGSAQTYTLYSNAVTNESIGFTGISTTTLAGFVLGTPHTMTWTLPKTFPVSFVRLGEVTYTGLPDAVGTKACEAQQTLAASAVTGTVTVPSTMSCNGSVEATAAAEIYVQVWGIAGEFTTAYYQLR